MFQDINNLKNTVKFRKKSSISSPNIINLKEMHVNRLKEKYNISNLKKRSLDFDNPTHQSFNDIKVPNIKLDISGDINNSHLKIEDKNDMTPTVYNPYKNIESKHCTSPVRDMTINIAIDTNRKKNSDRSTISKTKSISITKHRRKSEQYLQINKPKKNKSMCSINSKSCRINDYVNKFKNLNESLSKFDKSLRNIIKKAKREPSNDTKRSCESKEMPKNANLQARSIESKRNQEYYKCKTYKTMPKPLNSLFCGKLRDSKIFKKKPLTFENEPLGTSVNFKQKANN